MGFDYDQWVLKIEMFVNIHGDVGINHFLGSIFVCIFILLLYLYAQYTQPTPETIFSF